MSDFLDNPYLHQNTPEARSAIESARAENKAKATELVRREVTRYASELLPGAVDRIVETQGETLRGPSPAEVAARVYAYLQSPAADRLRRPEAVPVREQPAIDFNFNLDGPPVVRPASPPKAAGPRTDSLRAALNRFASDFKTPSMLEKFYSEHALTYAHAEPADAIHFVVGALHDRKFRAYQKDEAPPSEATLRLVEALKPFDGMVKGRLLDLAEGDDFSDMAGPNSPTNVKQLAQLVEARLKAPRNSGLLIDGEFDPSKVVHPRPAQLAAAEQAPSRPPLFNI